MPSPLACGCTCAWTPSSESSICSQLSPPPFPTVGTTVPLPSRVPHHLRQHVLTHAHDSKQLWAGATPCRQNCCCPPPWPALGPPSLFPWVQTTSTSAERTTTSVRTSSDRGSPELGKSALGRWILPPPGALFLLLAMAAARGTPADSSNRRRLHQANYTAASTTTACTSFGRNSSGSPASRATSVLLDVGRRRLFFPQDEPPHCSYSTPHKPCPE